MITFVGFAELADLPSSRTDIRAQFDDDQFTLSAGEHTLGSWRPADVEVFRQGERFLLRADGDTVLLEMDDPVGFWAAASEFERRLATAVESIPAPDAAPWWQFWQASAWRAWSAHRSEWRAYRRQATSHETAAPVDFERNPVVAPTRPISPAWLPAAALLVLAAVTAPPTEATPDDTGSQTTTSTTAAPTTVEVTSPAVIPAPPPSSAPTSTAPTTTTLPPTTTSTSGEAEEAPGPGDGDLVVHFFDVGQGDSTLLAGPDFTIVIDAGRHDRGEVVSLLRSAGVEQIDLLVGTHPHADHIGQMDEVLGAFEVTEVWMSGDAHTTATFERVLDAVLASDAGYHEPRTGESYTIGSALVEVLNPPGISGDLHMGSIGLRVVYGDVAFVFTGDAESGAERAMVRSGLDLGAQILKVGHHGSSTATSSEFLDAVAPAVAVYSAAVGNQYGHPHPEVIERLQNRGIEVFGTDVHGTVTVTTDGATWTVTTGAASRVMPIAPTTTAPPATTTSSEARASSCGPGQVDINTAGFEELQRITHIGPDRAGQILDLRPFASVDSMDRISGIGPARLADIKAEGIACVG